MVIIATKHSYPTNHIHIPDQRDQFCCPITSSIEEGRQRRAPPLIREMVISLSALSSITWFLILVKKNLASWKL
jgi:hypothetical protein